MNMEKDFGYREETKASEAQMKHREIIYKLVINIPTKY